MYMCYYSQMGMIFKSDFFEIHVFSKDHKPSHFHVYFPKKSNASGFVKIQFDGLEIIDLENVSRKDIEKLEKFLTKSRIEMLKSEWENFHGED